MGSILPHQKQKGKAKDVRLSRRDQEWLAARREIEAARANAAKEAAALKAREDAREKARLDAIRATEAAVRDLKAKLVEVTTCQ